LSSGGERREDEEAAHLGVLKILVAERKGEDGAWLSDR